MLNALAFLLLLPVGVAPIEDDPWTTAVSITLQVGAQGDLAYSFTWSGIGSASIDMPKKLSNWACRRSGAERGGEIVSFVECRQGSATIVIDVACRKAEADADLGAAILFNKTRDYAGKFVVSCTTSAELPGHDEPDGD